MTKACPPPILDSLISLGLILPDTQTDAVPLQGGVSSDIWKIETKFGPVCAKQALAKLTVKQDWTAPVGRNSYEAEWFRQAISIYPDAVPRLLSHDETNNVLILPYFPPDTFSTWKEQLRSGKVCQRTVKLIAAAIAKIHAGSAERPGLADTFANPEMFEALRIAPYLRAAADVNPACGREIEELILSLETNGKAMIHGDFSPKNILVGEDRIVLLDAECATWGDPAFDLAFCLNHLLLKAVWTPSAVPQLHEGFQVFTETYCPAITWEPAADLLQRAYRLLPGLLLARIDGKSPVEYITREDERAFVKDFALKWLTDPKGDLTALANSWFRAVEHQTETEPP